MAWIVRCRVSGGVTGTRESVLESEGEVLRFPDGASAAAEAADMREKMNGPRSRATFEYWATEE